MKAKMTRAELIGENQKMRDRLNAEDETEGQTRSAIVAEYNRLKQLEASGGETVAGTESAHLAAVSMAKRKSIRQHVSAETRNRRRREMNGAKAAGFLAEMSDAETAIEAEQRRFDAEADAAEEEAGVSRKNAAEKHAGVSRKNAPNVSKLRTLVLMESRDPAAADKYRREHASEIACEIRQQERNRKRTEYEKMPAGPERRAFYQRNRHDILNGNIVNR